MLQAFGPTVRVTTKIPTAAYWQVFPVSSLKGEPTGSPVWYSCTRKRIFVLTGHASAYIDLMPHKGPVPAKIGCDRQCFSSLTTG